MSNPIRMELFAAIAYAYPSSAGGYEPSFALACYLAWRDLNWNEAVSSPRPGTLQWNELAADFTSMESRELNVEPGLVEFPEPMDRFTPARLPALHDFAAG